MRVPSHQVTRLLNPSIPVPVRNSDYSCFNSALPYAEAIALAARGEVEAIATPGGKVRYLRLLTDGEKPRLAIVDLPAETILPNKSRSRSTVVVQTNMGVYRQPVESSRLDQFGVPTRIVVGHVWAHCGLRGAGI